MKVILVISICLQVVNNVLKKENYKNMCRLTNSVMIFFPLVK